MIEMNPLVFVVTWLVIATLLIIAYITLVPSAYADPAPSSIYAALQSQRNKCQDESALAIASNSEELAKVKAELEALKKDFGVK